MPTWCNQCANNVVLFLFFGQNKNNIEVGHMICAPVDVDTMTWTSDGSHPESAAETCPWGQPGAVVSFGMSHDIFHCKILKNMPVILCWKCLILWAFSIIKIYQINNFGCETTVSLWKQFAGRQNFATWTWRPWSPWSKTKFDTLNDPDWSKKGPLRMTRCGGSQDGSCRVLWVFSESETILKLGFVTKHHCQFHHTWIV